MACGGLLLLFLGVLPPAAQAALRSVADNDWVTNGPVYAMARSGSTIYLGGSFSQIGPRTGPAVSFSGGSSTPDAGFPQVSGGHAEVRAAISDGAGGWYVGGSFTHVGGDARTGLAHVLASGEVDPNFAPRVESANGSSVAALALEGGTLYVGGNFPSIGGQARHGLAALNTADGSLQSWNPAPTSGAVSVEALALSGETLYVGGHFTEMGSQARSDLAAFTTSTGVLTSWAPQVAGTSPTVKALAVFGSTIYVAGSFDHVGGVARSGFAAVDTTGIAISWNPEASGCASIGYALAVTGTVVYVGGCFTHIGGQPRIGVAALDPTTAAATSWNPEAAPSGSSVTTLAVSGAAVDVGGNFTQIGGQARNGLAALDAATATVTSWNPNPNVTGYSPGGFALQVDVVVAAGSQVLAGGDFTSVGGVARKDLAAIDATTGKATEWNPDVVPAFFPHHPIQAISVAGGAVYVGGSFSSVGGQARANLAALDPSTGTATSWNPGASSTITENGAVSALLATPMAVYVGGSFTILGGRSQHYLGAVGVSSGTATNWSPQVTAPSTIAEHGVVIDALALAGTTLYVGGGFTELGGQARSGAGAVSTESGSLTSWDPVLKAVLVGEQPYVSGLSLSGSTVYVAAGQVGLLATDASSGATLPWYPDYAPVVNLTSVGGVTTVAVTNQAVYLAGAGLDASSGLPLGWNPQPSFYPFGSPVSTVMAYGTHVYLAGGFTTTEAAPTSGFAAFTITGPINTTAPTITGTAAEGQVLSEQHGSWTGTPTSYAYQWVRCTHGTPPTPCTPIVGATAPSYTLTTADAGATIEVQESATNAEGVSDPVGSPATAAVLAAPVDLTPPTITGTPSVGETLTCSPGTWSNSPTSYQYAWMREGEPIPDATGSSYVVTGSDVGHDLSCEVTATNAAGSRQAFADAGTIPASENGGGSDGSTGGGQTGGSSGDGTGTGGSTGTTGGGSTEPSPSAVAAALTALLSAKTPPTIAGVLGHSGFSLPFNAPGAGLLSIHWMANGRPGGHRAKSVVVASGSRSFSAAERGAVKLHLTTTGRKLLKKTKALRIIETVTFTPSGGSVQTKQATLMIRVGTRTRHH